MAGKLLFDKLTHSRLVRQPVTTKSQRNAADAKGADRAKTKTLRTPTKLWILLIYSISAKVVRLPPSAPLIVLLTLEAKLSRPVARLLGASPWCDVNQTMSPASARIGGINEPLAPQQDQNQSLDAGSSW